jgi:phosphoribosylglycinamide formyltransferase-1
VTRSSVQRIAFIASSGGGVIDALARTAAERRWPLRVVGVVTDRPCGAEAVAVRHGATVARFRRADNATFSRAAAGALRGMRPDIVVLLFTRLVTRSVWDRHFETWNLHPSLLPAFSGLGSLERNHAAAAVDPAVSLGVTMHRVDGTVDGGPVLAQARFSIDDASHAAFLMKFVLLADGLLRRASVAGEATADDRYAPAPLAAVTDAATELARDRGRALLTAQPEPLVP